ncbi:hypothetical protein TRIUR3_25746 [Triticum urartu]|uniref:Uncharacterized protein n=1 Tax=Triticum urartu TaxID=4572 RepID=M7Z7J4_TRIUA|nr:hypothetical protein TRIUR3_25746 [Triticum urartu]
MVQTYGASHTTHAFIRGHHLGVIPSKRANETVRVRCNVEEVDVHGALWEVVVLSVIGDHRDGSGSTGSASEDKQEHGGATTASEAWGRPSAAPETGNGWIQGSLAAGTASGDPRPRRLDAGHRRRLEGAEKGGPAGTRSRRRPTSRRRATESSAEGNLRRQGSDAKHQGAAMAVPWVAKGVGRRRSAPAWHVKTRVRQRQTRYGVTGQLVLAGVGGRRYGKAVTKQEGGNHGMAAA